MKPSRYIKRPVIIEAMQFDGSEESFSRISTWVKETQESLGRQGFKGVRGLWIDKGATLLKKPVRLQIKTLDGNVTAQINDWVIKGTTNEFYPCRPQIFTEIYERVNDDEFKITMGTK